MSLYSVRFQANPAGASERYTELREWNTEAPTGNIAKMRAIMRAYEEGLEHVHIIHCYLVPDMEREYV